MYHRVEAEKMKRSHYWVQSMFIVENSYKKRELKEIQEDSEPLKTYIIEGISKVKIEGSEALTNNQGSVWFLLQALEKYAYSIEKDGFEPVYDSMFLEIDTTVSLLLSPVSNGIENYASSGIRLYPNPASDRIFVFNNMENAILHLADNAGRVLKLVNIEKGENSFDISSLPEGIYYIKVFSEKIYYQGKVVVQH